METYYDILQVNKLTSKEIIVMAYKALAKKHHPDLNPIEKNNLLSLGLIQKYQGSLSGGLINDDKDLTDYIREHIPVNELFVFGCGVNEDEE